MVAFVSKLVPCAELAGRVLRMRSPRRRPLARTRAEAETELSKWMRAEVLDSLRVWSMGPKERKMDVTVSASGKRDGSWR